MSFTSALPAASVRFCYYVAVPLYTDLGRGTDSVSFFQALITPSDTGAGASIVTEVTVRATVVDYGSGSEPVSRVIYIMQMLPWDQSFTYGLPALLYTLSFRVPFRVQLVKVNPGDLIMPDHHNVFALFWQQFVPVLQKLRPAVEARRPDLIEEYDSAISTLVNVIASSPTVEKGDYVSSEHFNIRLDMLDAFLNILQFLIHKVLGSPDDLASQLMELTFKKWMVTRKMVGDLILARDYNALVDVSLDALKLFKSVRARLAR